MSGRIGRTSLSVGDLVGPSSPPLATVMSQDPIYLTFPVSARELLEVRRKAEAAGNDPRTVEVRLRLPIVVSIVITLAGPIAPTALPIAQFPNIVPRRVQASGR